jgi:hypothetical protein
MNKIDQKKKIFIIGSICVVIIAGLIFGIIYPYYNKIVSLNKDIYDKRVQLAIYEQQRSNAESTRKDYNKIKDDTDNIQKIFVYKDKILDFISALESTATQYTVKQTINFDPNENNAAQNFIHIKISTDGDWNATRDYLTAVERLHYYLNITDISMTSVNSQISLVLDAVAYTQ